MEHMDRKILNAIKEISPDIYSDIIYLNSLDTDIFAERNEWLIYNVEYFIEDAKKEDNNDNV